MEEEVKAESKRPPMTIDEVIVVSNEEDAKRAALALMECLENDPSRVHALDTEVEGIDLSTVGPVGNGKMTCFTVYSGEDFDYGFPGKAGRALFVETLDSKILEIFRIWLESTARKVWHNYGFDRHIVENHGVECGGFAGDTMHMARLWDSNRAKSFGSGGKGYSLESLSEDLIAGDRTTKTPMKVLFADFLKDHRKKVLEMAKQEMTDPDHIPPSSQLPVESLQLDETTRDDFICYAAYDAKSTWQVYDRLRDELKFQEWISQGGSGGGDSGSAPSNMLDVYERYFVPFGKILTDMESSGIYVDKDGHLKEIEKIAEQHKIEALKTVRAWTVQKLGREAGSLINLKSNKQMQHFLFGGAELQKTPKEFLPPILDCDPGPIEDVALFSPDDANATTVDADVSTDAVVTVSREVFYDQATAMQLKMELAKRSLPTTGTKMALLDRLKNDDERILTGGERTETGGGGSSQQSSEEDDLWSTLDMKRCLEGPLKKVGTGSVKSYTVAELKSFIKAHNEKYPEKRESPASKKTDLVEQLRKLASARHEEEANLKPVEAPKAAVIRLDESEPNQKGRYAGMNYHQLCGAIRARHNDAPDTAEECIKWLEHDDMFCFELQQDAPKIVGNALEKQSHDPPPKHENERMAEAIGSSLPRPPEASTTSIIYTLPAKPKKHTIRITTLGLKPKVFTPSGLPAVSSSVIADLAGSPEDKKFGSAHSLIGDEGCEALSSLNRISGIEKMLTTFIRPLRELTDDNNRVHCSLNLNTETGRLSSRCPNLQNQPAHEKDTYKIRHAFRAPEGKKLIVADYGQLELRILAAITNCESMLTAFREGGCFHSRTAVGMFENVREAVESGEVLLEKGSNSDDDRPLVKDVFGGERRKAKTMNFSIAYGKSSYGFMKDFDITRDAAEKLVEAWYGDRQEVRKWQEEQRRFATEKGYVTTLLGRRRHIPEIRNKSRKMKSAGERAAINTPIQGSAADIVMAAMIKLHTSEVLGRLGWKLLLQIHDEVILEGPDESSEEAFVEVKKLMECPYDTFGLKPLAVDLPVDAKIADTWFDAK